MTRNNMTTKAYTENVFAKGFGVYVRTVPASGNNAPYIGYIKTTLGEAEVPHYSKILFETLVNGEEISGVEYVNAKLTAINTV